MCIRDSRCAAAAADNMRHTKFNESEDYKLIECVKVRPELYDSRHENNKNFYVKEKIWNAISSEMGRDGE